MWKGGELAMARIPLLAMRLNFVSLTSGLSCRCFSSGILNLLSFLRFRDVLMTPSANFFIFTSFKESRRVSHSVSCLIIVLYKKKDLDNQII